MLPWRRPDDYRLLLVLLLLMEMLVLMQKQKRCCHCLCCCCCCCPVPCSSVCRSPNTVQRSFPGIASLYPSEVGMNRQTIRRHPKYRVLTEGCCDQNGRVKSLKLEIPTYDRRTKSEDETFLWLMCCCPSFHHRLLTPVAAPFVLTEPPNLRCI